MNPRLNLQARKNRRKRNEAWDRDNTTSVTLTGTFGTILFIGPKGACELASAGGVTWVDNEFGEIMEVRT